MNLFIVFSFFLLTKIHNRILKKTSEITSNLILNDNLNNNVKLNEELESFFEKTAISGSEKIKKLTIEERVKYVEKGAFLEDEIYLLRDDLVALESKMLQGKIELDKELIKNLRDELNGLKNDYIDLVGGDTDLPLYFGRTTTAIDGNNLQ